MTNENCGSRQSAAAIQYGRSDLITIPIKVSAFAIHVLKRKGISVAVHGLVYFRGIV